jgi:hypothetical protein
MDGGSPSVVHFPRPRMERLKAMVSRYCDWHKKRPLHCWGCEVAAAFLGSLVIWPLLGWSHNAIRLAAFVWSAFVSQ